MHTDQTIPTDERLFDWLAAAIGRIHRGSIQLTVERGRISSIDYRNERQVTSLPDLQSAWPGAPSSAAPQRPEEPEAFLRRLRHGVRRLAGRLAR